MTMLRDFAYDSDSSQLRRTLQLFNIAANDEIAITRFEIVSPDSFMWRLYFDKHIYYLYAEDYVASIGQIKTMFDSYTKTKDWIFIEKIDYVEANNSSADSNVAVDTELVKSNEITKYAVQSGYDYVFLARSTEDVSDGLFSNRNQGGFKFN